MILSTSKVPHWDVIDEMVDDEADENEDVNPIHDFAGAYDHDNHDSEADNDHERFPTGT